MDGINNTPFTLSFSNIDMVEPPATLLIGIDVKLLFTASIIIISLSTIVPVAVAVGFDVLLDVITTVNVSVLSTIVSSIVGTITVTLVAPAGIVTDVVVVV